MCREIQHNLMEAGIRPGDLVASYLLDGELWPLAYAASWDYGVSVALVHPSTPVAQVQQVMTLHSCRACLVDELTPGLGTLRQISLSSLDGDRAHARDSESPGGLGGSNAGAILSSSGSTGTPKGIRVSGFAIRARLSSIAGQFRLSPSDVYLAILGPTNPACIFTSLAILSSGGCVVVRRWAGDPEEVVRLIQSYGVSYLDAPPFVWEALGDWCEQAAGAWRPIRVGAVVGESPAIGRLATLQRRLSQNLWTIYGASEAGAIMAGRLEQGELRYRPFAGVAVRISHGEVVVQGEGLFDEYCGEPSEVETPLVDGAWRSGDLAEARGDGSMVLTGRRKLLIKRGGNTVRPDEVEAVLCGASGVAEAVVVGVPTGVAGDAAVAFVTVVSGGPGASVLLQLCRAQLPGYKCPDEIRVVSSLPRLNGKIDRGALVRLAREPQ